MVAEGHSEESEGSSSSLEPKKDVFFDSWNTGEIAEPPTEPVEEKDEKWYEVGVVMGVVMRLVMRV